MTDKGSACEKLCAEIRSSGVAPNAACGFWTHDDGPIVGGETDALFDLASVTKSFFAVACARAGLREKKIRDVPLELMLAHRAGFPAHLPLFETLVDGARVEVAAAIEGAWASRSGPLPSPPLYSDVGYLLAGDAVATDRVDDFIRAHVPIADVGSARRMDMARAVPTEHVAWRGGEIRGHVHDENAWALGGDGACGHAGLFGTIGAVLGFGAFVLENLEELEWLVRPREGGTLRAGFDGKSAEGSSAGTVLGARSFGHLGFTGTSVWIDPDARIVVALLTNRVCPTRENVKIREARPRVHDALASLAR